MGFSFKGGFKNIKKAKFGSLSLDFIVKDGLISYYRFENDIKDSVGNNDGENNGGNFIDGIDGKSLEVIDDNYAVINDINDDLKFKNVFSISFWFNPYNSSSYPRPISRGRGNREIDIIQDGEKIWLRINNDLDIFDSNNMSLGTNKWHHIVINYDNNNSFAEIIANDDYRETTSSTIQIDTSNTTELFFNIPNDKSGDMNSAHTFEGALDNVRFYNRLLTDDEISELYNNNA